MKAPDPLPTPSTVRHVAGPVRRLQLLLTAASVLLPVLPGEAVTPFIAMLVLGALVAEGWLTLRMRRLRAQLLAEDYRVCPSCGVRLSARREDGRCPHCGALNDAATLKAQWEAMEF